VRPVRIDRDGRDGPTPGQARGPCWRRTSPGFYVPDDADPGLVEQRIVEQGIRLNRGVVTGWAALRLLGGGYFDGLARNGRTRLRVQAAANGDRLTSDDGLEVHRVRIEEADVVVRYGVRCASPERAVFDAVRWASELDDRVVVVDMAAAGELTSIHRLAGFVTTHHHLHGRLLVVTASSWADERARSPQEVRLRLIWRRRFNYLPPLVNWGVLGPDGRRLGTPDLLDERLGMGAEFDGAEHRDRRRHRVDVRRLDDFQRAGLEIATFMGADLDDEELVVGRLRATRERAGRMPRLWRPAPPGPSLDERLDHRDFLRTLAEERGGNL
jgi:hypothetical protein